MSREILFLTTVILVGAVGCVGWGGDSLSPNVSHPASVQSDQCDSKKWLPVQLEDGTVSHVKRCRDLSPVRVDLEPVFLVNFNSFATGNRRSR